MIIPPTLYFVLSDLGEHGLAGADPLTHVKDAAERWLDHRRDGDPAKVFEADMTKGTIKDVTFGVAHIALSFYRARRDDPPEWLMEEIG